MAGEVVCCGLCISLVDPQGSQTNFEQFQHIELFTDIGSVCAEALQTVRHFLWWLGLLEWHGIAAVQADQIVRAGHNCIRACCGVCSPAEQ